MSRSHGFNSGKVRYGVMVQRIKELEVMRIAVDRIDQINPDDEQQSVVRVEFVPLAQNEDSTRFIDALFQTEDEKKSSSIEKENLSWWNLDQVETKTMKLSAFRQRLGLSKSQTVVEGMVFWEAKCDGKVEDVFHATQAARALSQKLYSQLLKGTTSQNDESQEGEQS